MSVWSARFRATDELPLWPAQGPREARWRYQWTSQSWDQMWANRPTGRQRHLLTLHWRQRQAFHRLQRWGRSFLPEALTLPAVALGLLAGLAGLLAFLPRPVLVGAAWGMGATLAVVGGRILLAHQQARRHPEQTPWRVFWDDTKDDVFPIRPWFAVGLLATVLALSTGLALALPSGTWRLVGLVLGGMLGLVWLRWGILTWIGHAWNLSSGRIYRHRYANNRLKNRQRILLMEWAWPCELPDPALREAWRARGLTQVEAYIERAQQSPLGWTRWDQAALCQTFIEGPESLPALGRSSPALEVDWGLSRPFETSSSVAPEDGFMAWQQWMREGQLWPAVMPLDRVLQAACVGFRGKDDLPTWLLADLPRLWSFHEQAYGTTQVTALKDISWSAHQDLSRSAQDLGVDWLIASLSAPASWWAPLLAQVPTCAPAKRSPQELLWRVGSYARMKQWDRLTALETHAPTWVAPADYLNVEACHGAFDQVDRRVPQVAPEDRYPFLQAWAHPDPIGTEPAIAEPVLACLVEGVDLAAWWAWHRDQVKQSTRADELLTDQDPLTPSHAYASLDRLSHYVTADQQRQWLAECPEGTLPATLARVRGADLAARPAAPTTTAPARRRV